MAGPTSAGRISRLQRRPACVSTASTSPGCVTCIDSFPSLVRQFFPQPHVSNASFVARNHHFRPLGDYASVLAARAAHPTRAHLGVGLLTGDSVENGI